VWDSVPAFRVKLGANDLNCIDVPLNPTHSLTYLRVYQNVFSFYLVMQRLIYLHTYYWR